MEMYEFLHHLRRQPDPSEVIGLHGNFFFPTSLVSITQAEDVWGLKLPSQLTCFYQEVGWGQLQTGKNGKVTDFNYVASPEELVAIAKGTSDWLLPYTQIEPNTLPFFERDVDLFLCLHPHSDNPNAVWWMWGEKMPNGGKISNSLVDFFQRLVEDPNWFNPTTPTDAAK